ncbi:MAG TPA: hypothetical protein VMU52_08215, partial [Steroidobacteraceae bacterium]|nr:hypothetical protein [Steroidobacteraceae bacterium]
MAASGLSLDLNTGDNLTVASGATTFTFSASLASGATYEVTIATQPSGELCTASANTGTVSGNVTSVKITCGAAPTFTVGGTVT